MSDPCRCWVSPAYHDGHCCMAPWAPSTCHQEVVDTAARWVGGIGNWSRLTDPERVAVLTVVLDVTRPVCHA